MSGDLIDTTEMYLKAVYELEEAGIVPMRARITERLKHSGPTVSQTVARMERDGLLQLDPERRIRFTAEGRDLATAVMRKHRLVERHLVDDLALPLPLVHDEACRWEHVVSDEVERRIASRLSPPWTDPFGNPIPGLAEIGVLEDEADGEGGAAARGASAGSHAPAGNDASVGNDSSAGSDPSDIRGKGNAKTLTSLLEAAADVDEPVTVQIVRIGEPAQAAPGVVDAFTRQGVRIGTTVQVTESLLGVELRTAEGGRTEISPDAAAHILVQPISAD